MGERMGMGRRLRTRERCHEEVRLRVRASIVAIAAVGWLVSAIRRPRRSSQVPTVASRSRGRPDSRWMGNGSDVVVIRRNAGEPAWNAAGTRIAFSGARRRQDGHLRDGGRRFGGSGRDPVPSGLQPGPGVVSRRQDDRVRPQRSRGTDLYTVGRRGRNLTRLTTSPRIVERAPEWSPDGSRILFSRVRETGMPTDEDLFTIASDGSDLTRLTRSRLHDFRGRGRRTGTGSSSSERPDGWAPRPS